MLNGNYFKDTSTLPLELQRAADGPSAPGGTSELSLAWHTTFLLWPLGDVAAEIHSDEAYLQSTDRQLEAATPGDTPAPRRLRLLATGGSGSAHEPPAHEQAAATSQPYTLVLLDGSWPACRQMLERSPPLQRLRRLRIVPTDEVAPRPSSHQH